MKTPTKETHGNRISSKSGILVHPKSTIYAKKFMKQKHEKGEFKTQSNDYHMNSPLRKIPHQTAPERRHQTSLLTYKTATRRPGVTHWQQTGTCPGASIVHHNQAQYGNISKSGKSKRQHFTLKIHPGINYEGARKNYDS